MTTLLAVVVEEMMSEPLVGSSDEDRYRESGAFLVVKEKTRWKNRCSCDAMAVLGHYLGDYHNHHCHCWSARSVQGYLVLALDYSSGWHIPCQDQQQQGFIILMIGVIVIIVS